MTKKGKILLLSGAGAAILTTGIVYAVTTSDTASKLSIVLENFSLSSKKGKGLGIKINIPKIIFNAELTIHNPTKNDLTISKPNLKVFYKDEENPIGASEASDTTYTLKAKQGTPIAVDILFSAEKVLPVMPDFLKYIASRIAGKPSTRKVKIEMNVSGNGFNQTENSIVAI
jgi:hypothetical protein